MMTLTTPESIRRKQLAQIHIAKGDLGLDDGTYRAVLLEVAGVSSAADLSAKGRRDVLAHFESKGWKAKKHKAPAVTAGKAPYVRKIGALLADMKLSWNYAHGISKQMYKKHRVQWLEPDQLRAVVAALVREQAKRQAQHGRHE